jgi:hypothetical protein
VAEGFAAPAGTIARMFGLIQETLHTPGKLS